MKPLAYTTIYIHIIQNRWNSVTHQSIQQETDHLQQSAPIITCSNQTIFVSWVTTLLHVSTASVVKIVGKANKSDNPRTCVQLLNWTWVVAVGNPKVTRWLCLTRRFTFVYYSAPTLYYTTLAYYSAFYLIHQVINDIII